MTNKAAMKKAVRTTATMTRRTQQWKYSSWKKGISMISVAAVTFQWHSIHQNEPKNDVEFMLYLTLTQTKIEFDFY